MKKEEFARKAMLQYFNKTLVEAGVISAQEYQKLKLKIKTKYTFPPVKKVAGGEIFYN